MSHDVHDGVARVFDFIASTFSPKQRKGTSTTLVKVHPSMGDAAAEENPHRSGRVFYKEALRTWHHSLCALSQGFLVRLWDL